MMRIKFSKMNPQLSKKMRAYITCRRMNILTSQSRFKPECKECYLMSRDEFSSSRKILNMRKCTSCCQRNVPVTVDIKKTLCHNCYHGITSEKACIICDQKNISPEEEKCIDCLEWGEPYLD